MILFRWNSAKTQKVFCLSEVLSLDPRPSYQDDENRIYGLSFADFQVKFRVENQKIYVIEITGDKN